MRKKILMSIKVERRIRSIRGQRVMLDADLAVLYGVLTKNLNKAVARNRGRFPADFMFRLSPAEAEALRFQIGTSKSEGRGGRRSLPYAFTEQGVAMLSTVLRSQRAVQVNIAIMRAFVKLRHLIGPDGEWVAQLGRLERRIKKHDTDIRGIIEALRELMTPSEEPKKRIGFVVSEKNGGWYRARVLRPSRRSLGN